ncbi:CDP-alcohol phosphatidyltransferase family protein [Histomonas meleagridis]|uniref:CDP-alcohol phosphatidyltransferase family protein n=1 Tax=Histomonas meleagridis TaxID=135588 RepID=UPI0035594DA5|nr:CDP-alcohol phosphatidyltransferase family protein [Histomonas meleagridis]KAH0805314.1 CDP-alcohol phosphatidyltransferase family protein [Histomonas meleagridis]
MMNTLRTKFSEEDIDNAKKYKYNGKDNSIFVKLFLRSFWDWCIQYVPKNIAPNLITFTGFLIEFFTFWVSLFSSNFLAQEIPRWLCFLNGISLFVYQTLDNLDGRQARRTNSSSPLGQFFDHGCDAITGVSELIKVVATLNLGQTYVSFNFVFLMSIGFYFTSVEEYVLHEFNLGFINGPDEGLLILAFVHVFVGIFPSSKKLFNNVFSYLIYTAGVIWILSSIFINIFKKYNGEKDKLMRFLGATGYVMISIVIFLTFGYGIDICAKNPFFIMASSLVLQFQSQNIILAFLTKRPPVKLFTPSTITVWSLALVVFIFVYLSGVLNYWALYFTLVLCIIILFDVDVCLGLSIGLDIPVFTLKAQEEEEKIDFEIFDNNEMEEDEENPEEPKENVEETKEIPLNVFKDGE